MLRVRLTPPRVLTVTPLIRTMLQVRTSMFRGSTQQETVHPIRSTDSLLPTPAMDLLGLSVRRPTPQ